MQPSHRIRRLSYSISRTYRNTTTACKVSLFAHFPNARTHIVNSEIRNIPAHSLSTFFPSNISSFHPYLKKSLHFKPSSAACRFFNSPKAGLTRAMPNSRKRKGDSREVEVSKNLSYLLRHGAKAEGIQLDEAGWANVADVVGF